MYRHATAVIGALIVPLKFRRQLINVAEKYVAYSKRRAIAVATPSQQPVHPIPTVFKYYLGEFYWSFLLSQMFLKFPRPSNPMFITSD